MDRAHVELDPTGQIEVNTAKLYEWPKGEKGHFDEWARTFQFNSASSIEISSPRCKLSLIERHPQELSNGTSRSLISQK